MMQRPIPHLQIDLLSLLSADEGQVIETHNDNAKQALQPHDATTSTESEQASLLPLPSAGEGRGEGVPPQAAQHLNAET